MKLDRTYIPIYKTFRFFLYFLLFSFSYLHLKNKKANYIFYLHITNFRFKELINY